MLLTMTYFLKNFSYKSTHGTLVEREALVRAFSPGSTLEPGLKAFHRRDPKWVLEPLPTETKCLEFKTKTATIMGATI
jgi:hypothetical protein